MACPGCYPTAVLLALLPLVKQELDLDRDIIIDAKSGVSGAGRTLKQNILFSEAGEGVSPYGIGSHRHVPEIEQELALAAKRPVAVNFTPHLVPMSRGELCTCYVRLAGKTTANDVRAALSKTYGKSPFVCVVEDGVAPATQHVRGSNECHIGVFADRIPGRVIVISAIDNLVKGSAGQALQNFNLMYGFDETLGLEQFPLFPLAAIKRLVPRPERDRPGNRLIVATPTNDPGASSKTFSGPEDGSRAGDLGSGQRREPGCPTIRPTRTRPLASSALRDPLLQRGRRGTLTRTGISSSCRRIDYARDMAGASHHEADRAPEQFRS